MKGFLNNFKNLDCKKDSQKKRSGVGCVGGVLIRVKSVGSKDLGLAGYSAHSPLDGFWFLHLPLRYDTKNCMKHTFEGIQVM